jgi:hypothetical protein
MKYSAFAEAAVEATAGMKEIDAEIERLTAKRDVLEALAHQLLMIVPEHAAANRGDEGDHAGMTPGYPAAEQPSYANGAAEDHSYSAQHGEWQASSAGATTQDAPAAEQPLSADYLSQAKPYSLRTDGWPASSAVDQRGIRNLL